MGIYDRDYYRYERPGFSPRAPRTVVTILILINAAIYVVAGLTQSGPDDAIAHALGATPGDLTKPWMWWQLITYGFVHAPVPWHILGNMLMLFFLGRDVEELYGRREFATLYLVLLAVSGAVWALVAKFQGLGEGTRLIGASGAITGIVILFAVHFPRRTILLFFVIPMPAWMLGVIAVVSDMLGVTGSAGARDVAYVAHLAGAAFAALYFYRRWNLTRWIGRVPWPRSRPHLRVHDPDAEQRELNAQVDQILEKISRDGEASLSRKERRILETASREYQRRRQQQG